MWLVVERKSKLVLGVSELSSTEANRRMAIREVVPAPASIRDVVAMPVDDASLVDALRSTRVRDVRVEAKGEDFSIHISPPQSYMLRLTCDATEFHPVDRVPQVVADGTSSTIITVTKVDAKREPVSGDSHEDHVYLRADQGKLVSEDGQVEISSLALTTGGARFCLVAGTEKRVATVKVFNADPNLTDASIRVEFS